MRLVDHPRTGSSGRTGRGFSSLRTYSDNLVRVSRRTGLEATMSLYFMGQDGDEETREGSCGGRPGRDVRGRVSKHPGGVELRVFYEHTSEVLHMSMRE